MKVSFLAFLMLVGTLAADCVKPKPIYKVTKISLNSVIITCNDGTDPTGITHGEDHKILIVSCGE